VNNDNLKMLLLGLGVMTFFVARTVAMLSVGYAITEYSWLWNCQTMGNEQCGDSFHIGGFIFW
jgi:hypothetical protein